MPFIVVQNYHVQWHGSPGGSASAWVAYGYGDTTWESIKPPGYEKSSDCEDGTIIINLDRRQRERRCRDRRWKRP